MDTDKQAQKQAQHSAKNDGLLNWRGGLLLAMQFTRLRSSSMTS